MGQCCAPQTQIPSSQPPAKQKVEEEHDFKGVQTKIEGFYRGVIVRNAPEDNKSKSEK